MANNTSVVFAADESLKAFDTEADAKAWMLEQVGDPCVDNERFAFADDPDGMRNYAAQQVTGCCGEFDQEILVAGRRAMVGCNYGH